MRDAVRRLAVRAALVTAVALAAVAGVLVPSGGAVVSVTLGYVGSPAGGCGTDDIVQLLSGSPSYTVPADGWIDEWTTQAQAAGGGTVALSIWRPVGAGSYALLYRAPWQQPGPGGDTYAITPQAVETGDIIGLSVDPGAGFVFGCTTDSFGPPGFEFGTSGGSITAVGATIAMSPLGYSDKANVTAHYTDTAPDTTPPVLGAATSPAAVEATGAAGAAVTYAAPTATDAIDGPRPVTCLPASGSTFAIGTTTVTCQSSDLSANTATTTLSVVVRDTTPPALGALPSDIAVEATAPGGAPVAYSVPGANDIVDGTRPVSCVPAPNAVFPLGLTTVPCSTSDTRGNSTSATFRVTVRDTTPPAFGALPADVAIEADGPTGAAAAYTAPAASDLVDGDRPVTCSPATGARIPLGTATVTCTAADSAGNGATATFELEVRDTTPPQIAARALTAEATSPSGAAVDYPVTARDAVGPATPAVRCTPSSGTVLPLGRTTVACTARDTAGNTGRATFAVTVADTTPPAITVADVIVPAAGARGAVATFTAVAVDDVRPAAPAVRCAPASGTLFPIGSSTVTCTATDAAGNEATERIAVVVGTPELTGSLETTPAQPLFGSDLRVSLAGLPDEVEGSAELAADGRRLCTIAFSDRTGSCTLTGGTLPVGPVELTAELTSPGWRPHSTSLRITLGKGTPRLAVTAPAPGAAVEPGASVDLEATLARPDGTPVDGGEIAFAIGGAGGCRAAVESGRARCSARIAEDAAAGPLATAATFAGSEQWTAAETAGPELLVAPPESATTTAAATTTGPAAGSTDGDGDGNQPQDDGTVTTGDGTGSTPGAGSNGSGGSNGTGGSGGTDDDGTPGGTGGEDDETLTSGDPDDEVQVVFRGGSGTKVNGLLITVRGTGFRPGSTVGVSAQSTPIKLTDRQVDENGDFEATVDLPPTLEPGGHHIVVDGVLASGEPITDRHPFTLAKDGTLGVVGETPKGILAELPVYEIAENVTETLGSTTGAVAAVAAIGAAVAGGLGAAGAGGAGSGGTGGGGGGGGTGGGGRRPEEGETGTPDDSALAGAEFDLLAADLIEQGRGDLSRSWRWPLTGLLDRLSALLPARLTQVSPVLGRVALDGEYLRAMLGSSTLLLYVAAAPLAVMAAISTGFAAVPPTLPWFLAIMAISIFDALAGGFAAAIFFAIVLVSGGIQSGPELREMLAVSLVWFALPLGAAAVRPLRRRLAPDLVGIWERLADVVTGGFFAAWIIVQMAGALDGLIGFETPISAHTWDLALITIGLIAVRASLESLATHLYPRRLAQVAARGELEPGNLQVAVSLCLQIALFVFFAQPFMGWSWLLLIGTVAFFTPLAAGLWADSFPKSRLVARIVPAGIVKWAYVIFAGIVAGLLLERWVQDELGTIRWGFVILPIPVLILWALELFAAEDEDEVDGGDVAAGRYPMTWPLRVAGAAVIGACAYVVVIGLA